ncbi:hypothetical protein DN402_09245 [Streptomyces sp. SW4]|nr:hypothetical protein DN402_09245 [Streptomyces sp. SW4]
MHTVLRRSPMYAGEADLALRAMRPLDSRDRNVLISTRAVRWWTYCRSAEPVTTTWPRTISCRAVCCAAESDLSGGAALLQCRRRISLATRVALSRTASGARAVSSRAI